jgi:hypothetical protein
MTGLLRRCAFALVALPWTAWGAQVTKPAPAGPRLIAVIQKDTRGDELMRTFASALGGRLEVTDWSAAAPRDQYLDAARAMTAMPPDGRSLLLAEMHSQHGALIAAVQTLVPVAFLGEYPADGDGGEWFYGVFAPPGTPAASVRVLQARAADAVKSPRYAAMLREQAITAPGSVALRDRVEAAAALLPRAQPRRSTAQPTSVPARGGTSPPALPPGSVDAPVIRTVTTTGALRMRMQDTAFIIGTRAAWRGRALTLPPGLGHLRPVDAIVDRFEGGTVNIFMGLSHDQAYKTDWQYIGGRNSTDDRTSCSQALGYVSVGWFAVLHVGHQLPPEWTRVTHQYTLAIACGASTIDEAIALAYDLAKQEAGGRPFSTFVLQAGVTADGDWERLRREGRLSNGVRPAALAPWSFTCQMPTSIDAARGSLMPQDPGNGPAFAQYVMSPRLKYREYAYSMPNMDRSATYTQQSWYGCGGYSQTPEKDQPPPSFMPRAGNAAAAPAAPPPSAPKPPPPPPAPSARAALDNAYKIIQ